MRIASPALLLLLLALQLTQQTATKEQPLFRTSKIQLVATLDSNQNGRASFQLAAEYQESDKILISVLDFEIDQLKGGLDGGMGSWEVKFIDLSREVTLEATRTASSNTQSLLKVKMQLLSFSASLQGAIFFQNLRVSQKSSIHTLQNQMLLSVSAKDIPSSQKDRTRYTSVVLFRGYLTQTDKQHGLVPYSNIKSNIISPSHIHITVSAEGVRSCFVTIMILDLEKLRMVSMLVSAPSQNIGSEESSGFSVQTLSEVRMMPCQPNNDHCWKLDPKLETISIASSAMPSHQLTYKHEVTNQNSFLQEQSEQQFDFKNRLRLLSSYGCSPSSCSCSGFTNAATCFENSNCNCRIKTCINGYYTTASLVTSCTACPASLTNCISCGLKFGTSTVICNTCATGYTPLSGVCTACPTGCSTCTTILVLLVTKVTCQTCVSNLQLQTSGSIKICGCQSNKFLDLAPTPDTCVTCPAACLTCTSLTACTTCVTSYYLQTGSCLACMPVCKTCTTATTCATCYNTVFTLVGGVCTCPGTLYFDTVTKTCLSCTVLEPNCLSCSYSAVFDPANPPSVDCTNAAVGYHLSAGSAVACISYCNNCNFTPTPVCSTCNTNLNFTFDGVSNTCLCSGIYYFSASTSSCLNCAQTIPGCLTCVANIIPTPTQCNSCDPNGYFPTTAYPTTSCTACPSLCTACTSATACTACVNNLNHTLIVGVCTCDSSASLFLDSTTKTCLACGTVIFNCQTCNPATTPVSCTTCLTGTYPSADQLTCYPCPETCSACSSNTVCSACEPGYDLVSNACVCGSACTDCQGNSTVGLCASCTYSPFTCVSCSIGYILTAPNACTSCSSTWSNCAECTSVACLACSSPFIVIATGCGCNNTAGLYLTAASTNCLSCSAVIAQCTTCVNSGSTTCSGCANGYYLANALTCSPCAGNCLTCTTSATHCLNCLVTYVEVTPNTCDCDFANQYYYNPSTTGCSSCATLIPHCQTCTVYLVNQAQCSTCDNYYYWDAGTSSCSPCPSSCGLCTSATVCTSCPNNLVLSQSLGMPTPGLCVCDNTTVFLSTATNTCENCAFNIPSCTSCTAGSPLTCNGCLPSTYLLSNACVNCPSSCATCNQTQCLSCPGNLTLNNGVCVCDGQCGQCEALSIGCLSCTIVSGAITSCLLCEAGTYLSSPSCLACPSTCATCTSSTNCLTCQPTYVLISGLCSCATSLQIYPDANALCVHCSVIFDSCNECGTSGGSTVCVTCKDGHYVSGVQCQSCDPACLTCTGTATTCTSCLAGQTLTGTTCVCTSASCLACNAVSPNCVQCVYTIYGNLSRCDTCEPGYYPTALGSCTTCPSVCNTCGANGVCLTCFSTFSVIGTTCACNSAINLFQSAGTCQLCSSLIANCQTCTQNVSVALNVSCALCDSGYYSANASCIASVCGDGAITTGETCDDGNTISGDGCSSFCLIQSNFACTSQPSVCVISVNYHITVDTIETSKVTCNRVSITFKMDQVYDSYSTADFRNMLGYVSESNLIYVSWSYSKGKVTYDFDYTSSLNDASVTFYFSPAALMISETATLPIIVVTFKLTPTNNILLIYYNSSVCENKKALQSVATAVEYASYGTLALSMLPCKIVGLELFGVLQMAHLNVGNMDNVNTLMTPLMGMKGVHGYSMNLGEEKAKSRLLQSSSYTPGRVQSIGYEANFLRNCNVMLAIVVSVIVISLLLYLLTCFCKKCAPSLHSISKRIIKEVLLTLILFNCFNFAYSAGIHFAYAPKDDSLYTAGTVAAVLSIVLPVLMALGLMCAEDEGFGEYKEKFKPGFVERLYFVVTISYRTGIGLYISTMNEDSMSTLIVIALSLAFLLYNLVNLPYAKAYHNYRANICHLTQFVCLFVALYYRSMMSSTSRTAVSTVFSPVYLEFSCICLSLIVSLIVLVYEIYLFILECWQKKDNRRKISEDSAISNEKHATTEGNLEKIDASKKFQTIQDY